MMFGLQGVEFKLEIKNLALSDPRGHDLEKEIAVRVTAVAQKQVGPSLPLSLSVSLCLSLSLSVSLSHEFLLKFRS